MEKIPQEIFDQSPSLERLLALEAASWPPEEMASEEELKKRLETFPQGIFTLSDQSEDVAQITVSPKKVPDFLGIRSFEAMRDLPVDENSTSLWVTNLSRKEGDEYKGKGYASKLFNQVVDWAIKNGYESIQAGVSCDGYKKLLEDGKVKSIEDYMAQNQNPALNVFVRATQKHHLSFEVSKPIENYWPINESSKGYGVLVSIHLKEKPTEIHVSVG